MKSVKLKRYRWAILPYRKDGKLLGFRLRAYFGTEDEYKVVVTYKPRLLEDIKTKTISFNKSRGLLSKLFGIPGKVEFSEAFMNEMKNVYKEELNHNHFDLDMEDRLVFQKV